MTDDDDDATEHQSEPVDKFYRGTICKLQHGARRGVLRGSGGREIPFVFAYVVLLGPRHRFEDLYEGLEVGYDVSWTSKGLRVSLIRVPD